MDQKPFYSRLVALINTLCSLSTFTSVNLRGRGGDGDRGCGDGYSVHGEGWGWVSVSVPMQTSRTNSRPVTNSISRDGISHLHTLTPSLSTPLPAVRLTDNKLVKVQHRFIGTITPSSTDSSSYATRSHHRLADWTAG